MPAIFIPQGLLFRATEHASGPWSPDLLQGRATTALLAREVERLPGKSSFVVRRLTFDLWRPATMRAFARSSCATAAKPRHCMQLMDGDVEIGRCTALLTAQGSESPPTPLRRRPQMMPRPTPAGRPPAFAQKWSRYFQNVSVWLIEGALEKPGPAPAWIAARCGFGRGRGKHAAFAGGAGGGFRKRGRADRRHQAMDLHQP
jgi:hypothetical protein